MRIKQILQFFKNNAKTSFIQEFIQWLIGTRKGKLKTLGPIHMYQKWLMLKNRPKNILMRMQSKHNPHAL